jgi:hypothetical protein
MAWSESKQAGVELESAVLEFSAYPELSATPREISY